MEVTANRSDQISYSCTVPGFSTTTAILPYFLCEFMFNAILVFLFCRKLVKSLRLLLQVSGGGTQMMDVQVLQTIQLMSKMTLLMTIIFISTLLILAVMTNYLSSACISLDNVVNVISMLLVFKHNEKYYNILCCGCNRFCIKLCLFCCMKGIKINENEDDDKNDDHEDIMDGRTCLNELNVKPQQNIKIEVQKEEDDEYDFVNNNEDDDIDDNDDDDDVPKLSYDSFIGTLTVIFLNENSVTPDFRMKKLAVPMFID